MKLSKEEYKKMFEEYKKEIGPNPSKTFFGAWAWSMVMNSKFNKSLKHKGYEI